MEYHLVSVHTCAIRFHSSVCLQQHGSDFLDSYSAYHYEANCITLYRWGRYSTGSRLGSTGMQKKPTPTLLRQIDQKRGVAGLPGRPCFNQCAATPRWNIGDSARGIERCPDRCTG